MSHGSWGVCILPKFQRRHYVAIAEVFAQLSSTSQAQLFAPEELPRLQRAFAEAFRADNPAFKPVQFSRACGIPPHGNTGV